MMTSGSLGESLDMDMTSNASSVSGTGDNNNTTGIFGLEETVVDGLMGTHLPDPLTTPGIVIRGRSKVWNEFVVMSDGRKVKLSNPKLIWNWSSSCTKISDMSPMLCFVQVMCRRCGDSLAYSSSHSTSSMLKHLKRKHGLDMYPIHSPEDVNGSPTSGNDTGRNIKQEKVKRTPKSKKSASAGNLRF